MTSKAECRKILKSAAGAAKQLEQNVERLVELRAWDVLGYDNFKEMWNAECGFPAPTVSIVIAITCLAEEGFTQMQVATMIGSSTNNRSSSYVSNILKQVEAGVPFDEVTTATGYFSRKNRKYFAGPEDKVNAGFYLSRRNQELCEKIAQEMGVSVSEVYRKAIQHYLDTLSLRSVKKTRKTG